MVTKKLFPEDEGSIRIAIYLKDNNVVIDFGKDLSWIGLDRPAVEDLIKSLQDKLEEL